MDKLESLRVFIAVVEKGSLTAAADYLDVSRASVSRYLADLEDWMGVRLLHRTTRRLSLTGPGEEALARARAMLELGEELEHIGDEQTEQLRGLLRLTSSFLVARSFLTEAVTEFLERWPDVSIDLLTVERVVNLVEERIDLAIRITNELDPNVVARKLGSCRSVVCVSPEYLQRVGEPKVLADLERHNCLTYAYFGKSVWQFMDEGEPVSVPVSGNLSCNSSHLLLEATLRGVGVSFQPLPEVQSYLDKGRLVRLLPYLEPEVLGVYAVYTTRKQMTKLQRAFIDFLVVKMADDALWAAP